MPDVRWIVGTILTTAVFLGCQRDLPKEKEYRRTMPQAMDTTKQILQRYVAGASLGSEADRFPQIVEEIKKTDPQRATVLEQGFEELLKIKEGPRLAARAQSLLEQL